MKWLIPAAAALLPLAAWASMREDAPAVLPEGQSGMPADLPLLLPAPSFLESIGLLDMGATRGERNNNPGNIRLSGSPWLGKVAGTDAAFETFADPQAGIRALAKLLKNYQAQGFDTVRKIINRYAPASENNTAAYVSAVAGALGVSPDAPLDLSNDAQLAALVTAIIHHENGRVIYAAAAIQSAVELA